MTDRESDVDEPLGVVVTAGHVDHGKSSLLRRLTGIDPDRLEEEKRRGLTIDLGFAWCTLPSGREIGFVDVPGHERFIRTMLSGAGPVRLVLFVVAADEGWKPQTEEHLSIVDVLGVDGAVVALTKADLVDAERLAVARAQVRERLRGTSLERAPIVPCSPVSGEGMDELIASLDTMVSAAPPARTDDRPRQFVDRVFTIAGAGTVATGTLTGGPLAVGDEIEAHPSGVRGRIRGLQTHKREIDVARPVSRVAVNVAGLGRTRLERGDVIGRPGDWRATSVLEGRIRPVRGLAHTLTARGAFTLHTGAAERGARLRVYGPTGVPTEGAVVRIRLSSPLVVDVFDRFVLRESGRRETVAGGVVLDPAPPSRPGSGAVERLTRREAATRERIPSILLEELGAVRRRDLRPLTGADVVPWIEPIGDWWVAEQVRNRAALAAADHLRAAHAASPAAEGVDPAGVRTSIVEVIRGAGGSGSPALVDAILDDLVRTGEIVRTGHGVRLPTHRPDVADRDVDRVVAAVSEAEPTPPTIAELRHAGFAPDTIDAAVRTGALVRIAPDLVLTADLVRRALEVVRDAGAEGVTVSSIRQRLGTSRKYAVPLLEHLDRSGLTRRAGDLRFARGI